MNGVGGLLTIWLVIGAFVVFALLSRGRYRRAVESIARQLGGTRRGRVVTFLHEGTEYRCECSPGGRHQRPWIELRTDSAPDARYSAVAVAGLRSIGAGFGRGSLVTTTDPELDRTLRVYSDDALRAGPFFALPGHRDALRTLFGLGAGEVTQDDVELAVRWPNRRPNAAVADTLVPEAVAMLRRLAGGKPSTDARAHARWKRGAMWVAWIVLFALGGATGVLAGMARDRFQVLDWNRILVTSLCYSMPLALALGALIVRAGAMRSLRAERHGALTLLGGIVLLPVFVLQAAIVANGWLDDGPPTRHETRVLRTEISGGRHPQYDALVTSWREHESERLALPRGLVRLVHRDGALRVVTRPGRFGYEWVAGLEVEP